MPAFLWIGGTYGTKNILEKQPTRGSLAQALEIPLAACSSAGYFTGAVHGKILLLVGTSNQRLLGRRGEGLIHPHLAGPHSSVLPGTGRDVCSLSSLHQVTAEAMWKAKGCIQWKWSVEWSCARLALSFSLENQEFLLFKGLCTNSI